MAFKFPEQKIISWRICLMLLGLLCPLLVLFFLPDSRTFTLSPRNKAISDCADIALDPEIMGLAALPKTEKGIAEAVRRCRADMATLERLARLK